MQSDQFRQSRQGDWKNLTQLLERSQSNLQQLSTEEINTLGRLYRATTSDLALAQRDFPQQPVTRYLNQLIARAHAIIYRGEPLALNRLARFVTQGFPRVYRETLPFTFAAMLMFVLPALISAIIIMRNPQAAQWLLPSEVHHLIPTIEKKELWIDIPIDERPYASSFIMTNNIRVSFLAFGGGILAGLFTVWAMVFNGLILGGLTGLTAYHGVGFELWSFVIGHGVIELSVIFFAGGSGLMLGWAIIHPGLLSRRDALSIAAHKAVRLIISSVPLLIIAGLIEGFISPSELHWVIKWSTGLGSGVLLYSYLLLAGRGKE